MCKKLICECRAQQAEKAPAVDQQAEAAVADETDLIAVWRAQGHVGFVFHHKGTFAANYAAEAWCRQHGISFGSGCAVFAYRGLIVGDYAIAKWRNLNKREITQLHGRMHGDMREGPVTVELKERYVRPAMYQQTNNKNAEPDIPWSERKGKGRARTNQTGGAE